MWYILYLTDSYWGTEIGFCILRVYVVVVYYGGF